MAIVSTVSNGREKFAKLRKLFARGKGRMLSSRAVKGSN